MFLLERIEILSMKDIKIFNILKNINKYNKFIKTFQPFEINEGLIKTQDPLTVMSIFPRLVLGRNLNVMVNYNNQKIEIECFQIDKDDATFVLSLIANFGYFVADVFSPNNYSKFDEKSFLEVYFYLNNKIDIIFFIEPKYDIKLKNIPQFLYHSTLVDYVSNILKIGLVPKTKNLISNHPSRVYFSDTINKSIIFSRFSKSMHHKQMNILEIDTTKIGLINNFDGSKEEIKIYKDCNFVGKGFYTLDNIPNNAIKPTTIFI